MPLLSKFLGILITMYAEAGGKHSKPHFHAKYAEFDAVYDFEGNLLQGGLPKKQAKMVEVWLELRVDDLKTNWSLIQEGKAHYKIDPLQ